MSIMCRIILPDICKVTVQTLTAMNAEKIFIEGDYITINYLIVSCWSLRKQKKKDTTAKLILIGVSHHFKLEIEAKTNFHFTGQYSKCK